VWYEAWNPGLALAKYQDGEELTEAELNELVEYGTLHIVDNNWLEDLDEPTSTALCDSEANEPTDDWTADATEGPRGADAAVDGDEPGGCDVTGAAGDTEYLTTGDD
jgi:hypothetical protein